MRARELTSEIGESAELPRVLAGVADVYLVKGDLATAVEVAIEALAAAERTLTRSTSSRPPNANRTNVAGRPARCTRARPVWYGAAPSSPSVEDP